MFKNEGTLDRMLRVALGAGLLALVVVGPETWWGLVGIVPLFTGVIGFCPLYKVFGFSSDDRNASPPTDPAAQ